MIPEKIPKNLRNLLNNIFELEQKIINLIPEQQLEQEFEQQSAELNIIKQELDKTKTIIKNKIKRKNKLLNEINNKQKSINTKQQQLHCLGVSKRIIAKMQNCFSKKDDISGHDMHYYYENPIHQPYDDTRTDLTANIIGTTTTNLVVVEVIKPIIRLKFGNNQSVIMQKGIVIVASKDLNKEVKHEKND